MNFDRALQQIRASTSDERPYTGPAYERHYTQNAQSHARYMQGCSKRGKNLIHYIKLYYKTTNRPGVLPIKKA